MILSTVWNKLYNDDAVVQQYIRGVAVRVGSQDLSQQRSLTPKKTVSVHYIFGFFKNEFGFFIKQFKSVNSKKPIQIYCLLYTDNVQELFQRSKGIMNVKLTYLLT